MSEKKEGTTMTNSLTRGLVAAALGALVIGGAAQPTRAWSDINHREYLTFSGPVAIPGVILPAGTYMFEVPSPSFSNTLVTVRSRDGRQVYLTRFTNAVDRRDPGTPVTFRETARGQVPQIDAWYPMAGEQGRQFVY
jgi:hypothetical protein